ncbi:MAG TPA: PKD domain-containing protein [Candidatus Sulfotelmatobacter sp.]|nr:PKD domain-containing protein [Candidatus Sulfotelmatobacter sp.]
MARVFLVLAAVLFTLAACGQAPTSTAAHQPAPSPCPGPEPVTTLPPVTADITPVPTTDPAAPSDTAFRLDVPKAAELLVVGLDTNAGSQADFVPTFTGPDGQVVTRSKFVRDSFYPGNPHYGGTAELIHIGLPAPGSWILRVHLVARTELAIFLSATAIFHVHFPPLTHAQAQPLTGPAPLTVTFDASATKLDIATAATYCWSFTDDNSTAWGVKVTHTFRKAGSFDGLVTAYDDHGRQGYAFATVLVTS